jgi:hypothetical protein
MPAGNTTGTNPQVIAAQAMLAASQKGAPMQQPNPLATTMTERWEQAMSQSGGVDANAQPIAPVQPDDD